MDSYIGTGTISDKMNENYITRVGRIVQSYCTILTLEFDKFAN
jgi:hypothetical protein